MDLQQGTTGGTLTDQVALDMIVGERIEGPHEWHEYCGPHAEAMLHIYPDRKHYSVSLYEARTSWRVLKCAACNLILARKA